MVVHELVCVVLGECMMFDYTSARPMPSFYTRNWVRLRLHQTKCTKAEVELCHTEILAKTVGTMGEK